MAKKIYIAGKIGGLPEPVFMYKFRAAERLFQSLGWDVVNPTTLPHNHDKSWSSYMLEDLNALAQCDACYFMDDWVDSPGAKIEHAFAVRAGKQIIYQNVEKEVVNG